MCVCVCVCVQTDRVVSMCRDYYYTLYYTFYYTLYYTFYYTVYIQGDLALLVCPAEGCREAIVSEGVERVLQQDADAAARYRQLLSHATVTQNVTGTVSWCPAAGCEVCVYVVKSVVKSDRDSERHCIMVPGRGL